VRAVVRGGGGTAAPLSRLGFGGGCDDELH
jgi:hypothetical protein